MNTTMAKNTPAKNTAKNQPTVDDLKAPLLAAHRHVNHDTDYTRAVDQSTQEPAPRPGRSPARLRPDALGTVPLTAGRPWPRYGAGWAEGGRRSLTVPRAGRCSPPAHSGQYSPSAHSPYGHAPLESGGSTQHPLAHRSTKLL